MPLVPPGAVGLKFWRPASFEKRIADAWNYEDKSAGITLSNSDKTATVTVAGASGVRSTTGYYRSAAGKYYVEFSYAGTVFTAGFITRTASLTGTGAFTVFSSGDILDGINTVGSVGSSIVVGDILCLAWDSVANRVWCRKNNGLWNNDAAADPATGINGLSNTVLGTTTSIHIYGNSATVNAAITLRTELADFTYSVPSGFTSWMGEVVPDVTGTGELAVQEAAVGGTGDVGSAESTGDGALAADVAAVSGAGVSASTGTGALVAQTATAAGVGVSAASGAGTLAAQAATASGAGAIASTGTGALAAASATASGTGVSASVGTGALQAAAAAIVGAGTSASTGTGSLVAGSAEVAGTGTAAAANSGALVAQPATIAGLGVSESIGSGALQAGAAAVAGAGLVASVGTGDLVAGSATVAGEGVVIEAGAAVGTGALVAGAATISGEGEVAGEVAPPIFIGGGISRPPRPRPFPIEGIGYGILPQLEGEAHGLVGIDADGVATLSGVVGAGVGGVGVVGRSAGRLGISAAAVGVRGQAGSGAGVITLKGAAIGRHDDDEAAMIALLLAA